MQQVGVGLKAASGAGSRGRGPGRVFGEVLLIYLICSASDFFEATDLVGLGTLCSLDDIELHLIAFFEALVSLALDGAVVDEDIGSAVAAEESVALCVVEPFYSALVLCQWSDSLAFMSEMAAQ